MSGQDDLDPMDNRDDRTIAAEYALGLLEGEELLTARGRLAHDASFADRKAWWDNWFSPWTDEMAGAAEPSDAVWQQINARVNAALEQPNAAPISTGPVVNHTETSDVVVDLQSRLRRWQWTAGLTSAAAAVAVAFMTFRPVGAPVPADPGTTQIAAAAPLVASIPIGDTPLRLGVTFLPDSDEMLVSASGLSADGVHDHELWLVPADGSELQSLGVIVAGEERRVDLPANVARNMGDGVELVLTREPLGGKPEGVDAGPVVAQGALSQV
ncbi:MAG: anti-sigma factor [Pseudomonadota bacterium]